ncbi:hypothetical protein NPIL_679181 [Nephila pilipes]|uniref:Uncharacterized protein n=1 Tax=Nephila pilipes TaxID=299642 RepID=A0A8X6TLS3_NEPPI|nr:hypothetical protein NPIL_679181 [Nephila pilipes]
MYFASALKVATVPQKQNFYLAKENHILANRKRREISGKTRISQETYTTGNSREFETAEKNECEIGNRDGCGPTEDSQNKYSKQHS